MQARVRASGLKLTPQRPAIARELAGDPTAQELFERQRPAMPTMSFATVYHTLDALAAAGLCVPSSLSPGAARFDANMAPYNHAVCDRCGTCRRRRMTSRSRISRLACAPPHRGSLCAPWSSSTVDGVTPAPRTNPCLPARVRSNHGSFITQLFLPIVAVRRRRDQPCRSSQEPGRTRT
ncbi:MAG TPA: transcriptional repressor [Polyangium sp.]|nr:transcriptional repressor [Polyangium sp.]